MDQAGDPAASGPDGTSPGWPSWSPLSDGTKWEVMGWVAGERIFQHSLLNENVSHFKMAISIFSLQFQLYMFSCLYVC